MNKFSEYSKPTAELLLSLLEQAYEDEIEIDRALEEISSEVTNEFKKLIKELTKSGKIDLDKEVPLRDYPSLYTEIKTIEKKEWDKRMDSLFSWLNVVYSKSLTNSYKNTVVKTYEMFSPALNLQPIDKMPLIQITDTYITSNVLQIPWCQDGKTYSQRLYSTVANFQKKLNFVLEEGITKGKGMDWMNEAWRKLTASSAYESARLLKTETAAMWSLATKETYLAIGIEYVEIVGDAACGGICVDYVGEAIPLRDAELGDELPPYHPNCACSYVAYQEEEETTSDGEEE